jgi:hypothetical protein
VAILTKRSSLIEMVRWKLKLEMWTKSKRSTRRKTQKISTLKKKKDLDLMLAFKGRRERVEHSSQLIFSDLKTV